LYLIDSLNVYALIILVTIAMFCTQIGYPAQSKAIPHCNTGVSRRVFFKGIASTRGPNKNEIHIGTINNTFKENSSTNPSVTVFNIGTSCFFVFN
jgi:hypothetical protein